MPPFIIRPLKSSDRDWVSHIMVKEWGAEIAVVHNEIFHPASLPGFVAYAGGKPIGLLTYTIVGMNCEIITLNSWRKNLGVGTALIDETLQTAKKAGCNRLLVVTTNDNLHSLRFYKNRGFTISMVRKNAVAESRKLKPQIPLFNENGEPITDEIELEIQLILRYPAINRL